MQYVYTECKLPSNGKMYSTTVVHLRPKTIFDIKTLLNNPIYMIKSEIDALQNCIDPKDNIDVYDLVNQDVVYLLYKLRSMSDDCLIITVNNQQYPIKISELDVKYLENWENKFKLPVSGIEVELAYKPISLVFDLESKKNEFLAKYPDYKGDALNAVALINSISSIDGLVNKEMIRTKLEELSWKDSIFLINKIEEQNNYDFGIKEEVELEIEGKKVAVPIQISEAFFRPSI